MIPKDRCSRRRTQTLTGLYGFLTGIILITFVCLGLATPASLKVGVVLLGQAPGFVACLYAVEFHWIRDRKQLKSVTPGAPLSPEEVLDQIMLYAGVTQV